MKKPVLTHSASSILLFMLIAFLIYGKSINHGYNIDDNYVIENHELVNKGIKGIPEIFSSRYHSEKNQHFGYRPLSISMFAIETQLFGHNPKVHHLINILLYALLTFILLKTIQRLIKNVSPWFLIICSLIFLSHPIHTEVVLSLKNREEILCFLFAALSWRQILSFYDNHKPYKLILGLSLIGIAFLAKETAIVFVFIIPLSIVLFKENHFANKVISIRNVLKNYWIITIQSVLIILILWQPAFLNTILDNFIFVLISVVLIYLLSIQNRKKSSVPNFEIKDKWVLVSFACLLIAIISSFFFPAIAKLLLVFSLFCILIYGQQKSLLNNSSIHLKAFINKIPSVYIWLIGFTIIGGISLSVLYYVPDMLLPKENAPVYHWQNPLFTNHSISTHIALVFYSLAYYLKLLFIPNPLRFYYGYAMIPEAGLLNPVVIISIIIHSALIYIIFRNLKKNPILSFAVSIYIIGILPFSNLFFPLTGIIAERLLFVSSLGFSLAISWLIFKLAKQDIVKSQTKLNITTILMGTIIIVPFTILSHKRVPDWENRETLYNADISKLENSAKANNLYANYEIAKVYTGLHQGVSLQQMDKTINTAILHFKLAIKADSTYSNPYHNLGYIYMIIGKEYVLAESYFTKCISTDSTLHEAWMNRGVCRYYQNQYDIATSDLSKSKSLVEEKDLDKIYYYFGLISEKKQDTTLAKQMYDSALFYNPSQIHIIKKQKEISALQKDYKRALFYQNKLIQFAKPENDKIWVDKGNFELLSGDTISAITSWEKAFEIYPGNYNIGITLSMYFSEKGDIEKSIYYRDAAMAHKQ